MSKSIEQEILATGALQYGDFKAHNGEQGNCKLVLDALLDDPEYSGTRQKVTTKLAAKLKPFKPELIIPMPEGANSLGRRIALELGARAVLLDWEDKEQGRLRLKNQTERIVVSLAGRIALVDDVLRAGSTFGQAVQSLHLENKQLIGGVIWDRSDPDNPPDVGHKVKSVVKKYYPLWVPPEEQV